MSQDEQAIEPIVAPIRARVRPPGSKSITNRALICAALARGTSTLHGALVSDDTRVMIDGLRQLGIEIIEHLEGTRLEVIGCDGKIPRQTANLFVGNSGTTMRFLTPLCALGEGTFVLDGVARMRERPIGDLLAALHQLGVKATGIERPDYPPVRIDAAGLPGGMTRISGAISSQFLSGLLLSAPCAQGSLTIALDSTLVSAPYVEMTIRVMSDFGGRVEFSEPGEYNVPAGHPYEGRDYLVEPDASAASYFWAAAAVSGGRVTVEGLNRQSLQGDVRFCDLLSAMGCQIDDADDGITVTGGDLHGIDADLGEISDTVPTLAVVALFAKGPTRIRNVKHVRYKETDRLAALATELRKLGAGVVELDDGLEITPGQWTSASIATYDDHRMAMSFAVAGLVRPGLTIQDPGCVAKTYPDFFRDLETLRAV